MHDATAEVAEAGTDLTGVGVLPGVYTHTRQAPTARFARLGGYGGRCV